MQIAIFITGCAIVAVIAHMTIKGQLAADFAAAGISIGGYLLIGSLVDGGIDKFVLVAFSFGFVEAFVIAAFVGGVLELAGVKR